MLSDEEKKSIEGIKKDDEYYDILENIKQNKYNMLNVEKLMRDTTTGDYTEYEIAQSIVYFVNLIEKQSKEIEELNKSDESKEQSSMKYYNLYKELVDKIKEILGIEEDIDNEKILSLLQTIVDENARLEDIEDRKVQIEYNNVFNKGVKSVEDKIKAKIEEIDIEIQFCEYADDDTEEYKQDIEKEKRRLLRDKAVLQSLLEKE